MNSDTLHIHSSVPGLGGGALAPARRRGESVLQTRIGALVRGRRRDDTSAGARIFVRSRRHALSRGLGWLAHQVGRASPLGWERQPLQCLQHPGLAIEYLGRREWMEAGLSVLGLTRNDYGPLAGHAPPDGALISELPLPGTVRVPWYLNAVVPLSPSHTVAQIFSRYDRELRLKVRTERPRYQIRRVSSAAEIETLDRTMLRPFAAYRHGESAYQLSREAVRAAALGYGRLDVLLRDGEPVACHLGHAEIRGGRRLWVSDRMGYPRQVFEDDRRLSGVNSLNAFIALEFAAQNGFDGHDLGWTPARPEDGLLQWKRRRGYGLDPSAGIVHFHLRPPARGRARFFWNFPLLAREGDSLVLHAGLPAGVDLAKALSRLRRLSFSGLDRMILVHGQHPRKDLEELLTRLRGRCAARGGIVPVLEA